MVGRTSQENKGKNTMSKQVMVVAAVSDNSIGLMYEVYNYTDATQAAALLVKRLTGKKATQKQLNMFEFETELYLPSISTRIQIATSEEDSPFT
jgi:hypothetical protein